MSEEYELTGVIREYEGPAEAMAHLAALQAEGIDAVLTGDVPNAAGFHWIAGRLNYSLIQLVVPVSQREQAQRILEHLDAPPEEGWEDAVEGAIDGWICLNCDSEMPQDAAACSSCGALRSEQPKQDDEDEEEDDDE